MKGGVGVHSNQFPSKRRCKGFLIAVLALVFLSLLLPLIFLLGFYSSPGFPSSEQQNSPSEHMNNPVNEVIVWSGVNESSSDRPVKVEPQGPPADTYEHKPSPPSNEKPNLHQEHVNNLIEETAGQNEVNIKSSVQAEGHESFGPPTENNDHRPRPNNKFNISIPVVLSRSTNAVDEIEMPCELRFGSYCLWRREHKEVMIDSIVKKMKDRLFVARAYFPSIAKLSKHENLSVELKQNIQDFERILSEATIDSDLPSHIEEKIQQMEAVIAISKSIPVDCSNVDKKFRQLVDLTEDEANFHTKQSAFLYQLAVQTMPKSLHCLSMRLTVEYFNKSSMDPEAVDASASKKFVDPDLHHYVIFSRNVLASSVLINSTVVHAKESKKLVFHVLTDRDNYYSMKMWFFRITFMESAVQVLNLEDYIPESYKMPSLSLPEEFRVTFQIPHKLPIMQFKTKYISLFSYSHYFLPEIFKNLNKIVLLDDDMLVQKDLSALWKIDIGRNVNGAIEICDVRLGQLRSYLGRNSFDNSSCAWMSGLNVIDLSRWRELDLSATFRKFVHQLEAEGKQYEAAPSRATLLTFQNLVYPLDNSWVLSGLGHDYGVDVQAIETAATLHYNGNMKPFLEIGIPKYTSFWVNFMNRTDPFLSKCNVHPGKEDK